MSRKKTELSSDLQNQIINLLIDSEITYTIDFWKNKLKIQVDEDLSEDRIEYITEITYKIAAMLKDAKYTLDIQAEDEYVTIEYYHESN